MRQKRRRRDSEERSSRRRRVLRSMDEREWEEELQHIEECSSDEDDLPAWPEDEEIYDDTDWVP